jgi:hypothetical protein
MSIFTERVLEAINKARQDLSKKRGYPIYPESHVCRFVCEGVVDSLGNDQIEKIDLSLPGTEHHVLREKNGQGKIYDPQYKQFIPVEMCDLLPDTLIIIPGDKKDLVQKLTEMGIPQETAESYSAGIH